MSQNKMEEPLSPAEESPIAAISHDPKTIFLGGLFMLALLTALRIASGIVLPVVLAFVLKLVLQPGMRFLEKLHIWRSVSAIMILSVVIIALLGFGSALAGPAEIWAEKMPNSIPRLQERLGFLSKPIESTQKFILNAEDLTNGKGIKVYPVAIEGNRLSDKVFAGTQAIISGAFTTLLMLFFLLLSGDTFLRRLVEVLPRFKDKRQAVDISQHIESDISAYLATITVLNACVGILTGIIMAVCRIEDPILWGTIAFLLNYVPIIGPIIGAALFLFIGLLSTHSLETAVLPSVLYIIIHLFEGVIITPLLLAKRFTLNPVVVILSLIFWYWMWGLPGIILAMPMLAITKIICDRIHTLNAFGHFLEG